MNVPLRLRLIALGGCVTAVWLGGKVAAGEYGVPFLVATAAICGILMRLLRAPLDAIMLGLALFGYMVGNRGFAQLMPNPQLPLLPAEAVLLVASCWLVIKSAVNRSFPFRRDALNWAVLAWLVVGTVRVIFDVRQFGLIAVRDYAMIYYAAFFLLTQNIAREERSRHFLLATLAAASLAQPVAFALQESFPEFFLTKLVVHGVPLVYFKGDLALTFMAVSAFALAFTLRQPLRGWAWAVATIELVYVVGGANRASILGAMTALGWLAFSRARRFVLVQVMALMLVVAVVAGMALLAENSWAQRKLEGLTERVASFSDVLGRGTYVSEESGPKGDNNRFRAVWWRSVQDETMAQNPIFGLGFGYDLARNFVQEYNPDMAEDFTARSPHSILVSAIGRMGLVGLVIFVGLCVVLAVRTWRVVRDASTEPVVLGLWACIWTILVSACFGVVLEGPMGAVVFWSLLGLANGTSAEALKEPETAEAHDGARGKGIAPPEAAPALPSAGGSA